MRTCAYGFYFAETRVKYYAETPFFCVSDYAIVRENKTLLPSPVVEIAVTVVSTVKCRETGDTSEKRGEFATHYQALYQAFIFT